MSDRGSRQVAGRSLPVGRVGRLSWMRYRRFLPWSLAGAALLSAWVSAAFGATPDRWAEGITPGELDQVKAAEEARIRTIQQVNGSVVAIYGMQPRAGGSGVIYDPAGYALTNYHVVQAARGEGRAGLADGVQP